MNSDLTLRIKRKLQRELIKRKLIEYLCSKGYNDNFGRPLYPPIVYDLPVRIPHLFTKVEVVPTVEEVNSIMGTIKLGWNLFVLGTNRLYLGSTTHVGHMDLQRAVMGEPNASLPTDCVTTPKEMVEFILKILDNSRSGYIELPPNFSIPPGSLSLPLLNKVKGPRIGPGAGVFYSPR